MFQTLKFCNDFENQKSRAENYISFCISITIDFLNVIAVVANLKISRTTKCIIFNLACQL